jgi:hypothetical protein
MPSFIRLLFFHTNIQSTNFLTPSPRKTSLVNRPIFPSNTWFLSSCRLFSFQKFSHTAQIIPSHFFFIFTQLEVFFSLLGNLKKNSVKLKKLSLIIDVFKPILKGNILVKIVIRECFVKFENSASFLVKVFRFQVKKMVKTLETSFVFSSCF